jgi:hypothetical protein
MNGKEFWLLCNSHYGEAPVRPACLLWSVRIAPLSEIEREYHKTYRRFQL